MCSRPPCCKAASAIKAATKTCQFCAIGQSLAAGRTIERKTPAQLAEVAKAAVELDGVKHMVMTTGTPPGRDRGAAILAESARAVKAAVDLPIQGQCEPPDDDAWFARMKDAGIDALGMHLEAVTPEVRARIMPGKAQVSLERYFDAFAAAVPVFGRGQVSTYILAGLGDTAGSDPRDLREADRARRLSVRGAVRADLRHAAGKPSAAVASLHARDSRAAGADAARRRPAARPRSRLAAANAAPARRCRLTSGRRLRMIFEPFPEFLPSEYRVKFATEAWEHREAAALRRQVFCEEQKIFGGDDRDEIDDIAIPIVALSSFAVAPQEVVGTVRIHEAEPGVWWGSRLAVAAADIAELARSASSLIRLAVCSAHARGCRRFYAHVQSQNAPLFRAAALAHDRRDRCCTAGRITSCRPISPTIRRSRTPETGFLSLPKKAA